MILLILCGRVTLCDVYIVNYYNIRNLATTVYWMTLHFIAL